MEASVIFQTLNALKKELDALRPLTSVNVRKAEQKLRFEWNYHSNAIEGNSLDLNETRLLLLTGLTAKGKPLKDHLDIRGHNEVLEILEWFVQKDEPLTPASIREFHKILLKEPYTVQASTPDGNQIVTKTVRIGEYKTTSNYVETSTGKKVAFVEPENVGEEMTKLTDFYCAEEEKIKNGAEDARHPLALAAVFHYRFVRIHPFDDGNGRMARIFMNFILMRFGYPPAVIKVEDRPAYLRALRTADATGDLEPFTVEIGKALVDCLNIMLRAAKGENVDEIDDLDRKLELLDRIIKGMPEETKIKSAFSVESLDNIWGGLNKLIISLIETTQKFHKFYMKPEYQAGFLWEELHTFSETMPIISRPTIVPPSGDNTKFTLYVCLGAFKNSAKEIKGLTFQVKILFEEYFYQIRFSYQESYFKQYFYHQSISEIDLKEISEAWGNLLYEHTKKLADEAQNESTRQTKN